MIVNVDLNNKTWQMHLNGVLAVLHQSRDLVHEKDGMPLLRALQIIDSHNFEDSISTLPVCGIIKASILLEFSKLRLTYLNTEFNNLFTDSSHSRKLDIQKLWRSIKDIHNNLLLIPSMLPEQRPEDIYAGLSYSQSALDYGFDIPLSPFSPSLAYHYAQSHPNGNTCVFILP
jgi:hypothetical protein